MAAWLVWAVLAALLPAAALRTRRREEPERVPPPDYDSWTAAEKVAWFKANLDVGSGGSEKVGPWFDDDPVECMHEECIHFGGKDTRKDVVPRYACRSKGLHPEGMVAFVRAVWEDTPYTGMFKGSDFGFARWGYQSETQRMWNQRNYAYRFANGNYDKPPVNGSVSEEDCDPNANDCYNVTKGPIYDERELEEGQRPDSPQFMALKFFRDGVPSAAVHTGSLAHPTGNFISKVYSNLLFYPPEYSGFNNTTPGSISEQAAQRATMWPQFTGLHDMGMYDQQGRLQHDINFPWQLLFFPAKDTAGKIPENMMGWWPETVEEHRVLKPGTTLFEIYAKHSFEWPMILIGRLELASEFMVSADTDRQVFFYHPRYDRDLLVRPDLTQGLNCRNNSFCPICPIFLEFCFPGASVLEKWAKALQETTENPDLIPKEWEDWERFAFAKGAKSARRMAKGRPPGCVGSAAQRRGRRAAAEERQLSPMRSDDWVVEPLSGLLRSPGWFCAANDTWPNTNTETWRGLPEDCSSELVPWHARNEPEYALEPSCQSLPECTKTDGTWYSSVFPCLCGTSTCTSGQLCMGRTSTCTSWGPYAFANAVLR